MLWRVAPCHGKKFSSAMRKFKTRRHVFQRRARAALGISEGFFRVSVGVEDVELLLRDFTAGVAAASDA
jgi:cystathionine beta-lyase/cystathionine gamma-synthase